MTYKTAEELRNLTAADLGLYRDNFIASNEGVSAADTEGILAEITNSHLTYPVPVTVPGLVYKYFLSVFKKYFHIADFKVIVTSPVKFDGKVLTFSIPAGNGLNYMFLSEKQTEDFVQKAVLLEMAYDNTDEIDSVENVEQLIQALPVVQRKYIKWYLNHLGLRNKDEETPDEYEGVRVEDIAENPSLLDINSHSARFSTAMWADKMREMEVTLAGIGGIGSYVAFLLSRMQIQRLYMYDDDTVETVNMSGQLYNIRDVGRTKVDAMASTLQSFSMFSSVFALNRRFTAESTPTDVMICGFDNMEARRVFFIAWRKHVSTMDDKSKCLFIDGRLAAEAFQVFCIRGDDEYNLKRYEHYLFTDADADNTVCSYKQTTYMANMIGSVMVNLFTNFVANSIVDNIRSMPFFMEYDGELMTLKVKEA